MKKVIILLLIGSLAVLVVIVVKTVATFSDSETILNNTATTGDWATTNPSVNQRSNLEANDELTDDQLLDEIIQEQPRIKMTPPLSFPIQ